MEKGEWALKGSIFNWVTSLWGVPNIELMVLENNDKINNFSFKVPSSQAAEIDAFSKN